MKTYKKISFSKKALSLLLVICMVSTLIVPALTITSTAATPESGYTNSNSSTDVVAYKAVTNGYDVRGYYNGSWIKTTFSNSGYAYMTSVAGGSMTVTCTPSIVQDGNYVKLTYKVTAGSSGVTGGKLGVHADVMIGSNDSAEIKVIRGSDNHVIGLQMRDDRSGNASYNAQYRLYFDGVAGVTPASTYWMGRYSERKTNCFTQTSSTSYSGSDSGLAVSWQNINLSANASKSYSIIIGVGVVQQDIVVPTDPSADNFYLSGNYGAQAKFDTSMTFADNNSGVTDTLKCSIGGKEFSVASASATGGTQTLRGAVDVSSLADGTYTASFWILNSNGALSPSTTRTIVIEDGRIVSGLDAAAAQITLTRNGSAWASGTSSVKLGTTLSGAVANGSVLRNGSYNIYVKNHIVGSFEVDGGYTEISLAWTPIQVTATTPVQLGSVTYGTPFSSLALPSSVHVETTQDDLSLAVEWNDAGYVPTTAGAQRIYGTLVDTDYFALASGVTIYADVTVKEKPHTHSYTHVETTPTCSTSGVKKEVCECGSEINVHYIPALGHSYASEVTREATCTEPGLMTYTCTREACGHTYTVDIYAEHNYEMTLIEPTCTVDGATVYTCSECGDVNSISIPASHNYVSAVTKQATRYEDGEITYTCSKCGHSYTEVIPASNANILVIQDRIPWSVNNIPTLLNDMKADGYIEGWSMTTTANIGTLALADFDVILIANDQTTATYQQLKALDAALTAFVNGGGTLVYGACDHGWAAGDISFDILGTVQKTDYYSKHNYIVDGDHPIVTGSLTDDKALTNELLLGNYCSHSGFVASTLPAGYNIILQDGQGNATLAEYPLGAGRVILSGLTWEFYYSRVYTGHTSYSQNVFDDLIAYAAGAVAGACEHKYDTGVTVAPTCTTEGYVLHTCSKCGESYKDTYVSALDHDMDTWVVDREADCVTPGSKHQTCSRCGETVTSVTPALGHTKGDWVVDTEPTCTPGSRHKACTVCGVTLEEEEIAPVTEHTYTESSRTEATCSAYGEVVYTCECGATRCEVLAPIGHDYRITDTVEATCTAEGYIEFTCQNQGCGATKRQPQMMLNHHFGDDNICDRCGHEVLVHTHDYTIVVTAPTCTEMGYTSYSCSCGYSYAGDYIEPTRHSWDEGVVTTEATCTSDGVLTYTCERCSAKKTTIITASHEWAEIARVEKTCTTDGSVTRECGVCGTVETEIIPAGHDWNEGVETVAATCTTTGMKTCTCTACGATEDFAIPALGHTYVNGVCTRCGERFIENVKPSEHPLYGMYFEIDDILSDYGPSLIDEYGLLLDYNSDASLEKVAVYLTQDGTMWRRCIAVKGSNIQYATYVPYLSYQSDIKYTGLNHDWINIFRLSENSDGIWCYNNYTTIGVNLEDAYGNLLLSLYDIGEAGAETRIFDDLDVMIAWLNDECEHTAGDWIVETEPTCVAGVRHKKCTICRDILETEELAPVAEHISGEWIIDAAPTATQTGLRHKVCTTCGTRLAEEVMPVLAKLSISRVEAQAGSTVRVTINVQNNPGIIGALLTIHYDPALTLLQAEVGGAWNTLSFTSPSLFASPCNLVWDGVNTADFGNGTIVVLTFSVPAGVELGTVYNISATYTSGNMINADLEPVEIEIENGSITIIDSLGDVNNDGVVDVADVITLRRYLAGGYGVEINEAAADMDADGTITVADVVLLRRYLID